MSKKDGGMQLTAKNAECSDGRTPETNKLVRRVQEVLGEAFSDAEVKTVLQECDMDPNAAVQRLLSEDSFHKVMSKRERKKEHKEPHDLKSHNEIRRQDIFYEDPERFTLPNATSKDEAANVDPNMSIVPPIRNSNVMTEMPLHDNSSSLSTSTLRTTEIASTSMQHSSLPNASCVRGTSRTLTMADVVRGFKPTSPDLNSLENNVDVSQITPQNFPSVQEMRNAISEQSSGYKGRVLSNHGQMNADVAPIPGCELANEFHQNASSRDTSYGSGNIPSGCSPVPAHENYGVTWVSEGSTSAGQLQPRWGEADRTAQSVYSINAQFSNLGFGENVPEFLDSDNNNHMFPAGRATLPVPDARHGNDPAAMLQSLHQLRMDLANPSQPVNCYNPELANNLNLGDYHMQNSPGFSRPDPALPPDVVNALHSQREVGPYGSSFFSEQPYLPRSVWNARGGQQSQFPETNIWNSASEPRMNLYPRNPRYPIPRNFAPENEHSNMPPCSPQVGLPGSCPNDVYESLFGQQRMFNPRFRFPQPDPQNYSMVGSPHYNPSQVGDFRGPPRTPFMPPRYPSGNRRC